MTELAPEDHGYNDPVNRVIRWALLFPNDIFFSHMMVQATEGCSYDKCGFCYIHRDPHIPFRVPPIAEVVEDFKQTYERHKIIPAYQKRERAFIGESNPMVRPTADIQDILRFLYSFEPIKDSLKAVGTYARCDTVLQKQPDLARLREAGLTDFYLGVESGDDTILKMVNKGYDTATIERTFKELKSHGYGTHAFVISGLGGKERTKEHAERTAGLLNRLNPDTVMISPLTLSTLTALGQKCAAGEFTTLTFEEMAEEESRIVKGLDLTTKVKLMTCFRCGGTSIEGALPDEKGKILQWLRDEAVNTNHYKSCAPAPIVSGIL